MELMETIRKRLSIRNYQDASVPEDKLSRILEAARISPSARNSQDREFVVVRDPSQRHRLAQAAAHQRHVAQAPILIAAVSTKPEYHMPNGVPAYPMDVGIAIDHMTLVAVEEGLGTCWIGGFDQDVARAALGVPESHVIAAILTLGLPMTIPEAKPRRAFEDIIHHDQIS